MAYNVPTTVAQFLALMQRRKAEALQKQQLQAKQTAGITGPAGKAIGAAIGAKAIPWLGKATGLWGGASGAGTGAGLGTVMPSITPTMMVPGVSGAAGGAAGGAAAGAAGSAGAAGTTATAPMSMLSAGPLLGLGLIASGPVWAPTVSKAITNAITSDRPDRTYNRDEALKSKIIPNQIQGFDKFSDEGKANILDQAARNRMISLPGAAKTMGGPTISGVGTEHLMMTGMPIEMKKKMEEQLGHWWARKPIEQQYETMNKLNPQAFKSGRMNEIKSFMDTVGQEKLLSQLQGLGDRFMTPSPAPQSLIQGLQSLPGKLPGNLTFSSKPLSLTPNIDPTKTNPLPHSFNELAKALGAK